jgi:hypothetical protein
MALASNIVDAISNSVGKDYPEMRGCRPTITTEGNRYSLTYRTRVSTPAGSLSRIVRVVADETGRIIRMSTSK